MKCWYQKPRPIDPEKPCSATLEALILLVDQRDDPAQPVHHGVETLPVSQARPNFTAAFVRQSGSPDAEIPELFDDGAGRAAEQTREHRV